MFRRKKRVKKIHRFDRTVWGLVVSISLVLIVVMLSVIAVIYGSQQSTLQSVIPVTPVRQLSDNESGITLEDAYQHIKRIQKQYADSHHVHFQWWLKDNQLLEHYAQYENRVKKETQYIRQILKKYAGTSILAHQIAKEFLKPYVTIRVWTGENYMTLNLDASEKSKKQNGEFNISFISPAYGSYTIFVTTRKNTLICSWVLLAVYIT